MPVFIGIAQTCHFGFNPFLIVFDELFQFLAEFRSSFAFAEVSQRVEPVHVDYVSSDGPLQISRSVCLSFVTFRSIRVNLNKRPSENRKLNDSGVTYG